MTRIIVVEPHPLLRLGIVQLLADAGTGLLAEGSDYSQLNEESAEPSPAELVLLSLCATQNAHDLIESAQRVYSPRSMVLMAEHSAMPALLNQLPSSVSGYLPKTVEPEVLQASIRLVLAGGTCFPMHSAKAGVGAAPLRAAPVKWPPAPMADGADSGPRPPRSACAESQLLGLTPRQYEVLVLLARGYPMKTVGRCLNISVATAKAHTETLYQRLDVHNRNAAVYAAVSRGATLGWPLGTKPPGDAALET